MPSLKNWLLAFRPKTLVVAIVPVTVGAAFASRDAELDVPILLCIFVSALCIQIGTNLANDYSDFKRGADTKRRLGPMRVTQAGLIEPANVKNGAIVAFALAAMFGIPLILRGGWPILAVGVLGILSGWAYTGGPFPLGYHGLGELFVFLFFGVAAVVGTAYVLTLEWQPLSLLISIPSALHASAILVANNVRDIETDRAAGKRTLAAMLGKGFGRVEYLLCTLVPFVVPMVLFWFLGFENHVILLPILALPLVIQPAGLIWSRTDGPSMIKALGGAARLQLVFGLLFAFGLLA